MSLECIQGLLDATPHGVVYHDAEGTVLSANPAALRILGIAPARLKTLHHQKLERFCRREDGSRWPWREQPAMMALQTREVQRNSVMKIRDRRKQSGYRWLNISAAPIASHGSDRLIGAYTVLHEITGPRDSVWHQQEAHLAPALRGSNDGFWDWSLLRNEMVFSGRWWNMLGYVEDEITDQPDLWLRTIHPEDQKRVGQMLAEGLAGKADSFEMEIRLLHKAGHCVHVISRVFIERDQDGRAIRVSGTNVDITDRRQMEEALRQYQEELKAANETLEQRVLERTKELELSIKEQESFSYSVSHDLRAPLRHINSFASILVKEYSDDLPGEARTFLERICAASSKMGALIDDLLELSRVSRTQINLGQVDLTDLATQILQMHREIDPHRVVHTTIAEAVTVLGDSSLLLQLLENLLGNAWKYTSMNPSAHIEFGAFPEGGEEVFFVRDDGVGFDMEYQGKLFRAFERLHGAEFPGTGIGLATSQRIVKRHGGRIWAEGKVGEGATVFFTLPVHQ